MSDELDPKERFPNCECNYCQADEHWWSELLTAERERSARLEAELANLRAQPGGAVPPFWWTRGHRTHPPRPFATKMHDAHWLVRHEDGTLDTFAYETPDLYVAEGESVVEYRRVAATKADALEDGNG